MDVLTLSRMQFAVATYFHFLFVPLTLGLSVLTAIMETRYVRTGDPEYKRMTKFWGKLFLINFAVGVVTGITLEFQFGTNWSRYSSYVGDIFGSLLAIEATVAFFLESTFIAVWFFGWEKLSPRAHATTMWLVAIASNISAVWILIANAWMQHPTGYVIRNGRAELADFIAVVTQKFAVLTFIHTVGAAFTLAGFFVAGISAWHLLRKQHVEFFTRSFRLAVGFGLICSLFEVAQGHMSAEMLGTAQPTKLAAMESHWQTRTHAPLYLLLWPDADNERNAVQLLPVPSALSILAHYNPGGEVKGLKDYPREDRPPVLPSFLSFRIMVGFCMLFLALTAFGWWKRNRLTAYPWYLRMMVWAIPLPYVACEAGWTLTEVGRQPWIVYGLMRTRDAVSPIAASQVLPTLVGFILLYSLLGFAGFYLVFRFARKGPEPIERASSAPAR
ncbi:MAG: cytochrome ubiquinol oxidase subunit I [Acidobacteriota bacterium]